MLSGFTLTFQTRKFGNRLFRLGAHPYPLGSTPFAYQGISVRAYMSKKCKQ